MHSYKGFYKPQNPEKYKGDPNKIVYRSMLEKRFFKLIDTHPGFRSWASEEFYIPYINPINPKPDGTPNRYFVDLWVELTNGKKVIIEIKPHSQTVPPKQPKKNPNKSKRYLNECMTWAVNEAKWKAARVFCEKNNMEFMLATEKNLPKTLNG